MRSSFYNVVLAILQLVSLFLCPMFIATQKDTHIGILTTTSSGVSRI